MDVQEIQPKETEVHPRGRGEHVFCTSGTIAASGSSPRSRGTSLVVAILLPATRFIPAVAGNIVHRRDMHSLDTVHPRGRGEH